HLKIRDLGAFCGAGVLASNPWLPAPQYEILGPVWVLQPVTAATVGRDVTISGTESAFEGTVSWVVRSGGTVVKRGSATGVGAPARGPWSITVRLAPGSYTVRGYLSSAKDGSVTFPDDKSFTVR
ncbi:MAG: Gmad2 immunoglobulin-like domain-containing protein, partial [Mycobacteriales bacterium]